MAINQISVVGPRAKPQEQESEKKDPLDTILKGLQLAQGVTGIAVNYQTIQQKMAERQLQADELSGIQPAKDQQTALAQGLQPVPEGTAGSVVQSYRVGEGDQGVRKQAFILPPKEKPAEKVQGAFKEVQGPDGPVFAYITEQNAGQHKPVIAPPKPDKDISVAERNTLQSQYDRDPLVRKNRMVFSAYNEAQAYAAEKTPASDQALIIAWYKANDPNSIVKETEAETAAALGGLENRAKAKFSEMAGDGKLTDEQRADLLRSIQLKAKNAAKEVDGVNKQFGDVAGRRKVDMRDLRLVSSPDFQTVGSPGGQQGGVGEALAAPAPKVGEELDGYIFQGGDPAKPENWKKK